ncbi:membrane-bound O-acyltransferase family protein [Lottiidibacillus patelloidae]|uniref:Membrane-bound O-acyltransferase family protein n=1 Tax=Lottiidibacillus patelloidae TaxID=2670334 RepID=A0A263BVF7_9BACI|nr:MBOAT family protein [Lottiidibacillus patelloidae]OZM57699.1 membrane-bound O-acyltransferase family protein [Lottiidibacillus patelloidae]
MLFNSYEFIFVFLPIVFIVYFLLNKLSNSIYSKVWLVTCSLFFYSWWNVAYLPLIVGSLIFNFIVGTLLVNGNIKRNKLLLTFGILINVFLLGYFKYADFFIANINTLFENDYNLLHLVLPLAISFFTFQQIAYLVDSYRREYDGYNFLDYSLFVTFFPQLIAGPIVHHKEMMPQFETKENKKIDLRNISLGMFIFFIGLFKKVVIADSFAVWATKGFDEPYTLTFFEGWLTSLSYTMQLYFDFSGYCDMAIGAALLFNIRLPLNFNSPYKSLDIQDFWRRWHMTLGRFLTKYLYIPLGGNRQGELRTYVNILTIFLISGLWHGAGWTFVFWGFLHGLATVIHRIWKRFGYTMNKYIAWFITFNFVNIAWVFFRANSWADAERVLTAMIGLNGFSLPEIYITVFEKITTINVDIGTTFFLKGLIEPTEAFLYTAVFLLVVVSTKNSFERMNNFKGTTKESIWLAITTAIAIMSLTKVSEFLYFNF